MERVKGVTDREAGWLTKLVYGRLRKWIGVLPKSKTLAAYHTPLLLASTWMDGIHAAARTVPHALKELAQLKVAAMVGCPF